MATITVRPNETIDLGDAFVGGAASAHAALSDDNDSSYVSWTTNHDLLRVGLAEPSPPAGAMLKSASLRVRCQIVGAARQLSALGFSNPADFGSGGLFGNTITVGWGSIQTVTVGSPAQVTPPTDVEAVLDPGPGNFAIYVYELYADFIYVAQPVVDVTAPTGTVTDRNQPTVTWEMT